MNNIKISVITIVYNDQANISKTINSVLSQNYKNLEYIIIDGDSIDGSQDIIRSFGNSISRFISEPDDGISDAFNKGVSFASGELVGFLNSGDTYNMGTLKFVSDYYLQHSFHALCGSINNFEGDYLVNTQYSSPNNLKKKMSINHPSTFVRKDIIDMVNGFDTNLKYAMDYDLFLKIYKKRIKFHTVTNIFVNMQLGGVSNCMDAYKEQVTVKKQNLGGYKLQYDIHYLLRYLINIMSNIIKRISPRTYYYLKNKH